MTIPDLRARPEAEEVQVLQGRDVDIHHLPGQLDPAGHALQVSEELGGLPDQAARLRNRIRNWFPVQLCLLAPNGN